MTAATLSAKMHAAAMILKSAHVSLQTGPPGQTISAVGDETLSGGKVTGLDLQEQIPGIGNIGVRTANGAVYMKLPPAAGLPASKPWVNLSLMNSDPTMRQLASTLTSAEANASIDSYGSLTAGATTVKEVGPSTVDGVPTSEYSLSIDVAQLPAGDQRTQIFKQAGVRTIPADLWVDAQGRVIQLVESPTVSGRPVTTKVTVSRFDAPVVITAPPADQITTE